MILAHAQIETGVVWGSLALINAGLAQSKNHSGLGWFFLSLMIGPIATFFIVAVLSDENNT